MSKINHLTTEQRNDKTMNLDQMTSLELASTMNEEDEKVIYAIREILPEISQMIDEVTKAFKKGGRLIYMGAGTSGRLGVLDAVECPPTFGTDPEMVVGLIAGGEKAFVKAVEGAEDFEHLADEDLDRLEISDRDVVVGIAASGRTPYVIEGLRYARSKGCVTGAVACNANSLVGKEADIVMEAVVGPEVLTGSTRLKAGSAQKMILNMITTGSMVGIGKAYENLMIDVMQTNEKLVTRAENMVMTVTECERALAKEKLKEAEGSVKLAILSILSGLSIEDSKERLEETEGHLREAIK